MQTTPTTVRGPARTQFVPFSSMIRTDAGLQMRAQPADDENLTRLREIVREGGHLPPGECVTDGRVYWLTDGYVRATALEMEDRGQMECVIYPGGYLDARLRALRANAANGCGRTEADRRKAILELIKDDDLRARAQREARGTGGLHRAIARLCAVTERTVTRVLRGEGLHVHGGEIVARATVEPAFVAPPQTQTAGTEYAGCPTAAVVDDPAADYDEDDHDPPAPAVPPEELARLDAERVLRQLRFAVEPLADTFDVLLGGPLGEGLRAAARAAGKPFPRVGGAAEWGPLGAIRDTLKGVG